MKILTPLSDINSINNLISAGSDEFYLGYFQEQKKWLEHPILYNRRSHTGSIGNFVDFYELQQALDLIRKNDKKCFLTLNNHSYPLVQVEKLCETAKQFIACGGHGVICSDLNLIKCLINEGISVVLGTCGVCTNSLDIDFWKRLGVLRIVLPRDLATDEMEEMVCGHRDCQFEVFIMNSRCKNIESICSAHHGWGGNFCKQLRAANRRYVVDDYLNDCEVSQADKLYFHTINSKRVCGLCSIWKFVHMGVHSLKIVERTLSSEIICQQVRMINECIKLAIRCQTEELYLNQMNEIVPYYSECENNLQCYYCK